MSFTADCSKTSINGHFWYSDFTQEWVFEVETSVLDSLFSLFFIKRYTGKTKIEAIESFHKLFPETLKENLKLIK